MAKLGVLILLLCSPVATDGACKQECGQEARRCRIQCPDSNRSRCVNACQGELYRCEKRCLNCR